jgi:hypothetical protein
MTVEKFPFHVVYEFWERSVSVLLCDLTARCFVPVRILRYVTETNTLTGLLRDFKAWGAFG